MGLLVDGHWTDRWYDTSASGGRFQRLESAFRNWVTSDGAHGPTGEGGFKARSDATTSMSRSPALGRIEH